MLPACTGCCSPSVTDCRSVISVFFDVFEFYRTQEALFLRIITLTRLFSSNNGTTVRKIQKTPFFERIAYPVSG